MADEMQQQPNQPAQPSSGGSNTTKIVIIILVIVAVLGVAGYLLSSYLARRAGEKLAEGLIGAATNGQVDVSDNGDSVSFKDESGSMQIGDSAKWPSDMPSVVPKYSDGTIKASSKSTVNGTGWTVIIEGTSQDKFNAYKTAVEAAGWKNSATVNAGADIATYEKDNYTLSVAFDPSSNGLNLTVMTD